MTCLKRKLCNICIDLDWMADYMSINLLSQTMFYRNEIAQSEEARAAACIELQVLGSDSSPKPSITMLSTNW